MPRKQRNKRSEAAKKRWQKHETVDREDEHLNNKSEETNLVKITKETNLVNKFEEMNLVKQVKEKNLVKNYHWCQRYTNEFDSEETNSQNSEVDTLVKKTEEPNLDKKLHWHWARVSENNEKQKVLNHTNSQNCEVEILVKKTEEPNLDKKLHWHWARVSENNEKQKVLNQTNSQNCEVETLVKKTEEPNLDKKLHWHWARVGENNEKQKVLNQIKNEEKQTETKKETKQNETKITEIPKRAKQIETANLAKQIEMPNIAEQIRTPRMVKQIETERMTKQNETKRLETAFVVTYADVVADRRREKEMKNEISVLLSDIVDKIIDGKIKSERCHAVNDVIDIIIRKTIDQVTFVEQPARPTKGPLKPGKIPYIKPGKKSGMSQNSKSPESKKSNVKPVTVLDKQSDLEIKKNPPKTDHYSPGKAHNKADFKNKYMPCRRPCSKPRTKPFVESSQRPKILTPKKATKANVVNSEPLHIRYVQGHFHQGHPRFGEHSGKQCAANSVASMIYNQIKPVCSWDSHDIDNVLIHGNEIYGFLQRSSTMNAVYLEVTELPTYLDAFGTVFTVTRDDSIVGLLKTENNITNDGIIMSFNQALDSVFLQYGSCFVTFKDATFAIMKKNGEYFVFDSHSRSNTGTQIPDGNSTLLQYSSLSEVYEHCMNLAQSMNASANEQFEVTGAKIGLFHNEKSTSETSKVIYTDNETSMTEDVSVQDESGEEMYEAMSLSGESDSDIQICETEQNDMLFCPLDVETRYQLCSKLDIPMVYQKEWNETMIGVPIAEPCKVKCIEGDGNCFFRALSFALSGKENNHRKIRSAVTEHLKQNQQTFEPFLRTGYQSVHDYIDRSRMWYLGTWATELEIFAAADLLNVVICTFSDNKWLRHSPVQICNGEKAKSAIYLNHYNQSHYDVVLCAKTEGVLRNSCTSDHSEQHLNGLKRKIDTRMCRNDGNENNCPIKKAKVKIADCNECSEDEKETHEPKPVTLSDVNNSEIDFPTATNKSKLIHDGDRPVQRYADNTGRSDALLGNFHQGHPQFKENSGKQCVANSLAAMTYTKIKNILCWDSSDLDKVLYHGDELYGFIQSSSTTSHMYLLPSDLPGSIDAFDTLFTFTRSDTMAALMNSNANMDFAVLISLKDALHVVFLQYEYAFVTFMDTTFAVIKSDDEYFIFDSHSRDNRGLQVPNGASVLMRVNSITDVYQHCINLGVSRNANNNVQVDVTGIFINANEELISNSTPNLDNDTNPRKRKSDEEGTETQTVSKRVRLEQIPKEKSKQQRNTKSGYESKAQKKREYMRAKREHKNSVTDSEDIDAREQKLKREKEKYTTDLDFRNKKKEESVKKYHENNVFREYLKKSQTENYTENEDFKEYMKSKSKEKYATDALHRESQKSYIKEKYATDAEHREDVKAYSKKKYATDAQRRETLKSYSKEKYATDAEHREDVKSYSKKKYATDAEFKKEVNTVSSKRYRDNEVHRNKLKEQNQTRAIQSRRKLEEMNKVKERFAKEISEGPEYICSVCHRRLFQKQVIPCNKDVYQNKGFKQTSSANMCITEDYLHTCSNTCDVECSFMKTPSGKLWICYTCHRKLMSGKMPEQAVVNNLRLESVPPELECLNTLEEHLIALHIPFMKIVPLPKGGQHGMHGPVVSVPSDVKKTVESLPRPDTDDQMIRVKLKRKLTYKGHYQYQFLNRNHIEQAIEYLRTNNKWYKDIHFNKDWINPIQVTEENPEMLNKTSLSNDKDIKSDESNICEETKETELENEDEDGLLMDTCLQPVDIGQEVMDQHFETITSIAPAERNKPIEMLKDESDEAKAFPYLFPSASCTFRDIRKERITLSKYFNTRLMNADSRFATNTDYIFYAQYLYELQQVLSNVSVAMRKGSNDETQNKMTKETLTDSKSLKKWLKCDEGYKFLKPIRGTPPYWQSAQKDLFAMLRQLGIPTWFCSFSAAEMKWPETIEAILREQGDFRKANELSWSEKASILRQNPVTAARMFDHRFHTFIKDVIMSPTNPIGKIKDYFYRVEFQQRGSPHTHCLFWVEDAPKIDRDDDETVHTFVDKYVTCKLPSSDEDEELHNIIKTAQTHSKKHSKSCRKKGTTCRFNFPRPPSNKTFVSRPGGKNEQKESKIEDLKQLCEMLDNTKMLKKEEAKLILERIWNALSDEDEIYDTVDELFAKIGISQDLFQKAYETLGKTTSVVLKRNPRDVWVNQYNPDLLRCWDANMDIQFVVDAYSCVVYIISYISKAEREMGLLLSQTQKEAENNENVDAKSVFNKLGAVYLHNREVSAQEAIFRVCSLRLKEGSRKVQFIPTVNITKMSLPLEILQTKQRRNELGDDDIWMTNIVDRYKNRPTGEPFDNLCLASFCSEYRVLSTSEVSRGSEERRLSPVIKLQNGLGHVKKRTRTEAAVVRYAKFSVTKQPEKHYQSILQLFLPYRLESQLKPPTFHSFEEFYKHGAVQIATLPLEAVKEIVDRNKSVFEKEAEDIDRAEELLATMGPLEDAWAQICPETESERLECNETKHDQFNDESDKDEDIPDLIQSDKKSMPCKNEILKNRVSKEEAFKIMRSLNEEQSQIFYKIRQWCLDKKNGKEPDPFHLFLTGGAGTGKSYLIKAINFIATKILAETQDNPDDISVLLVAPTGVAALNISAMTVHSGLSIGRDMSTEYIPLGDEKINTLRSKYGGLQILIIDEISMVGHTLLSYVHGRLRQIKQTGDYSVFGRVSVIAVGDFQQLLPVKALSLFMPYYKGYDFWRNHFCVAELTKVVRQKDAIFAGLLNRLRKKKKSDSLEESDLNLLKRRETGDNPDVLHIYALNNQVDDYNITMLHSSCQNPISIEAQDFSRNQATGRLEKRKDHLDNAKKLSLRQTLCIAVGARVMLTKNIATTDGLVNGAFGNVTHIAMNEGETFPSNIYIKFDAEEVGQKWRHEKGILVGLPEKSTGIEPEEEKVNKSNDVRRQFAMKLAWACTVHKVQGITVDRAVVSLAKMWSPGQAYVALSRVTSLEGLIIEDFDESAIFCNEKAEQVVSKMPRFIDTDNMPLESLACNFIMQNIECLPAHIQDLKSDSRFTGRGVDFICLTETWLSDSQSVDHLHLDGFNLHHRPRSLSYQSNDRFFTELRDQAHGGVGIYISEAYSDVNIHMNHTNLECISFYMPSSKSSIAVIYRPQSYTIGRFKQNLLRLIKNLEKQSPKSIIMGDFNENAQTSGPIQKMMQSNNYRQLVMSSTTEGGTIIDHVYVRGLDDVSVHVLPTYFGYHEAVQTRFM